MDITITPQKLHGTIAAIASKSQAHRLLICAAFADRATRILCPQTNQDIEATAGCLRTLGADISYTDQHYIVSPITTTKTNVILDCQESGSTLRFMLPIVGALGSDAVFKMRGRLPFRPLEPLWSEMEKHGCLLSRPDSHLVRCSGQLRAGEYSIDGSISSQFISGLLFAMALMEGKSHLTITGNVESTPYITLTQSALSVFGITSDSFTVIGNRPFASVGEVSVEGDWSNAAFFLAAQALGSPLAVTNLNPASVQGDRAIVELCKQLQSFCEIDVADIPDLVPILSVIAAASKGAKFRNIQRLRLKESDRVETVIAMIQSLGGRAEASEDMLTVYGTGLDGGTVDSFKDHRIAMSAAIAATVTGKAVTILNAQCVEKSYPSFWNEYRRLGGIYEQYIR